MLIPGGGVSSGPIAGTLHVYVIARGEGAPIAGAAVRVGAADAPAPLTGTTDATGLASFRDAALTGAQTITVTAAGRTAATWIGANGANVTIPLDPQPRATPTAHVTGTIAGWGSLPAPSLGHYTLAVVLYTFVDDVAAPENSIAQPTQNGAPLDTCVRSVSATTCAWELTTRVGPQRHVATIVDGDAHGTPSDLTDDTYTLIGYATGTSMTLTAGQQVSGESLTMVGAGSLTGLSTSFPPAPSGLGHVVAIPMLDLGADGKIVFPLPTLAPGHTSAQVLAPTGPFAGTYDLVALATPSATANTPYSTVLADGISLGGAAIGGFLAPPTGLSAGGGAYTFAAVPGASLHYATFSRADGTAVWNVVLLDGSASFHLPAVSPDPLGAGPVTLAVTAAEVPGFDATHFTVDDLTAAVHRASGATISVTR